MDNTKVYDLKVNGKHEFTLTPEEITSIDAHASAKSSFHMLENQRSYAAKIIKENFLKKLYTVEVNGNTYEVQINDELDKLIKELGFEVGSGAKVNEIFSPMPGLIFDIMVKEGDTVTEEQPLLILEAMKMENVISSPREGVIKKIAVEKGQAIEKKALLIEFE